MKSKAFTGIERILGMQVIKPNLISVNLQLVETPPPFQGEGRGGDGVKPALFLDVIKGEWILIVGD